MDNMPIAIMGPGHRSCACTGFPCFRRVDVHHGANHLGEWRRGPDTLSTASMWISPQALPWRWSCTRLVPCKFGEQGYCAANAGPSGANAPPEW